MPQDQEPQVSLEDFEEQRRRYYQLPKGLVESLKTQESGGRQYDRAGNVLTSPKQAKGRYQVLKSTAAQYGLDPDDPFENVEASFRYLSDLHKQVDAKVADPGERWAQTLAGYHAGEGRLREANKTGSLPTTSDGQIRTDEYVASIMKRWQQHDSGETPQITAEPQPKTARSQTASDASSMPSASLMQMVTNFEALKRQGSRLTAKELADEIKREFGDVMEVGVGAGRWPFVKPKAGSGFDYDPKKLVSSKPFTPEEAEQEARQVKQRASAPAPGSFAGFINQIAQSAIKGTSGIPEGASELLNTMVGLSPEMKKRIVAAQMADEGKTPEQIKVEAPAQVVAFDNTRKQHFQAVTGRGERFAERVTPVDPTDEGFGSAKVPQAIGSIFPFAAATLLSGGNPAVGGALAATLGASMNAQQIAREFDAAGVPPEKRDRAILFAGVTGLTEVFGITRALRRFGLSQPFMRRVVDVAEEGGQEALQQYLNNVNAAMVGAYDPNRPLSKDVIESAILGGIVGGGVQAASAGASRVLPRREGAQAPRPPVPATFPAQPTPTAAPTAAPEVAPQPAPSARPEEDKGLEIVRYVDQVAQIENAPISNEDREAAKEAAREAYFARRRGGLPEEVQQRLTQPPAIPIYPQQRTPEGAIIAPPSPIEGQRLLPPATGTEIVPAPPPQSRAVREVISRPDPRFVPGRQPQAPAAPVQPEPARAAIPTKVQQAIQERLKRVEGGQRIADRKRQKAQEAQEAGDLDAARTAYEAEIEALKIIKRLVPLMNVGWHTQLRTSISNAEVDLGKIKEAIRQQKPGARAAKPIDPNAPTAGISTPLLDQVSNPEGGVPPRTEALSGVFGALARKEERGQDDRLANVRLINRIRQLGGINPAGIYTGELVSAVEKRYPGLINRRDGVKPDLLRETLQGEDYPIGDDLDSLFKAIDDDIAGKEVYPLTRRRTDEIEAEAADYHARQEEELRRQEAEVPQTGKLPQAEAPPVSVPTQNLAPQPPVPRTERLRIPKATPDNIADFRNRREELSRLQYDRSGRLTGDLADEMRELGSRIAEFENEQAKAERGGRIEDAPPAGVRADDRPFARPTSEDRRRALEAAEARLDAEIERATGSLPQGDAEALERGVAAIDALFEVAEQDADVADLFNRTLEGDTDAEAEFRYFADRRHGIDADTLDSILDTRRNARERSRAREGAGTRPTASRTQTRDARYGEDRTPVEASPQAQALSAQDLNTLNQNPDEVSDEDFDRYRTNLEDLNNRQIRGIVEMPEWAARQLEARLKQSGEVRRGRVKEKRLPARFTPPPAKAKPLSKEEGGRRLVEQVGRRQAETKPEASRTVLHPDPAIDGKPVIAETADGKVIIANPDNKGGVSVVKDRGPEGTRPLVTNPLSSASVKDRKRLIGKLMPFNIQGNKADLLAKGLGTVIERAAKGTKRTIDAFGGTGAYTHYLRSKGLGHEGDILNEFDPLRFITHKQLKENPQEVAREAARTLREVRQLLAGVNEGERFTEKHEGVRRQVADYLQRRLRALVKPGENLRQRARSGEPVEMQDTPETAGLYLILQNQSFNFLPVQAEVSDDRIVEEQGRFFQSAPLKEPRFRLPGFGVISNEGGKVGLFAHGKNLIFETAERAQDAGRRMQGVDVRRGDGWDLIRNEAGKGDLVPVDTSYLNRPTGEETSNYNRATAEDAVPEVYMEKVRTNLLPAWDRGAKLVITNNWDKRVADYLRSLGFHVVKATRQGASREDVRTGGAAELVAINFDKKTGEIFKRPAEREGGPMASVQRGAPVPGFYSQVDRVITQKAPNKASGTQMAAIVTNPQTGIKKEELEWLGIVGWLRPQATVTKQEVLEFIRANQVDVREVVKGGYASLPSINDPEIAKDVVLLGDAGLEFTEHPDDPEMTGFVDLEFGDIYNADDIRGMAHRDEAYNSWIATAAEHVERHMHRGGRASIPKFNSLVLPGAKEGSYRELLLTMPVDQAKERDAKDARLKELTARRDELKARYERAQPGQERLDIARLIQNTSRQIDMVTDDDMVEDAAVHSPHWSETNVLAHIRFNERVDADGKRTMFVEEFQSDKGQEWQKLKKKIAQSKATEAEKAQFEFLDKSFPFNKTEAWVGLAFKRALRWAVENSYDRVAWTTGETQAERSDLSKTVDSISARRTRDGTYEVFAIRKDSEGLINIAGEYGTIPEDKLEDYIGQDLAKKITEQAGGEYEYGGLDLKVGGEGMKGFYDQILPAFINKYVKKWGAKVEPGKIAAGSKFGPGLRIASDGARYWVADRTKVSPYFDTHIEADDWRAEAVKGITATHSLDITPQMRESVMSGQPLFAKQKPGAATPERSKYWDTPLVPRNENGEAVLTAEQVEYARSEFRQHATRARLYTNEQGAFFYATAFNRATKRNDQVNVDGLEVPNYIAWQGIRYLRRNADKQSTPALRTLYRNMADQLELAVRAADRKGDQSINIASTDVGAVINGGEKVRSFRLVRQVMEHEETHVWERSVSKRVGLFDDNVITSDPDYNQHYWALLSNNYSNLTPNTISAEAIAHVVAGQWRDMGYKTEEDAMKYLERVLDQAYTEYGADAINKLRLRSAAAKEIRENVIRRQPGERRIPEGIRAARQGVGEASPINTGGEITRSSQSLRGREGGRRGRVEGAPGEVQGTQPRRTRADVENSPEFRRWFRGSKVVDEQGKPLVVYHGTTNPEFDVFDASRIGEKFGRKPQDRGFWFSTSRDQAMSYARSSDYDKRDRARVTEAYLIIKNPAIWKPGKGVPLLGTFINDAIKQGRDGVIIRGQGPGTAIYSDGTGIIADQYLVFSPNQIKSATGNRGTFDPDNPSILASVQPGASGGFTEAPDQSGVSKGYVRMVDAKGKSVIVEGKPRAKPPQPATPRAEPPKQAPPQAPTTPQPALIEELSTGRDVTWYDYLRSPLSNLNYKGTYEHLAGETGREISEAFRGAQVAIARNEDSRKEEIAKLEQTLRGHKKTLRAEGKPGLANWLDAHVEALQDPDAAFRGLTGFLKKFQYDWKLRHNPRSITVNFLQPLQTLWPHLTTSEFLKITAQARQKETRERIAELSARESGGKVEDIDRRKKRWFPDAFGKVSESNRIMGHLAGELMADRLGLIGTAKARMAADWAKKVEFDNSRWDVPPLFRGRAASVIGQFKAFTVKNLERIYADWKTQPEGSEIGDLARRAKMVTAQLALGGVRSLLLPGIKEIGGVLILGGLAIALTKAGWDDEEADKMAEAIYFGAPGLIEQDLSSSVMLLDSPYGNTPSEKGINFLGGPTISLVFKAWKEGQTMSTARDTKESAREEKVKASGLRLAKAVTPYTKFGQTAYSLATTGKLPKLRLGKEEVEMTRAEAIGYGAMGTPLRQTRHYEREETYDWQKRMLGEPLKPNRMSLGDKLEGELRKHDLDYSRIDEIKGDTEKTHRERTEKVERWLKSYGGTLINSSRFKSLKPTQQKAALQTLRKRIGDQMNQRVPRLEKLAAHDIIRSTLESEREKPARDRLKIVVTPN